MKINILHPILIGVVAGAMIYFINWQAPEYSTDYIDVVDAIVDTGIHNSVDLESPGFLGRRAIISMTDVNANFSNSIIAQLLTLDRENSNQAIDLYLRTEGGWEADAFAVIDIIKSIKAPVNVHALGEVHSAGAMILAAGTGERVVYENTILGYHETGPDEDELFQSRYLEFWKKHADLPQEWLESRDEEMRYFTAQEALEMRVADEVRIEN
ncbi:MAG: ATP-dependent Clp protease proteolytic subunit [Verrucomicrobiales bacterium]|nr:ATP-dependent Clp protease proteolytic subunit [Verrucomicrobiales bacterium]